MSSQYSVYEVVDQARARCRRRCSRPGSTRRAGSGSRSRRRRGSAATSSTLRWSRSTRPMDGFSPGASGDVVGVVRSGSRAGGSREYLSLAGRNGRGSRSRRIRAATPTAMPTRTPAGDVPALLSKTRPMTMPPTTAATRSPPRPARSRPRKVFSVRSSSIRPDRFLEDSACGAPTCRTCWTHGGWPRQYPTPTARNYHSARGASERAISRTIAPEQLGAGGGGRHHWRPRRIVVVRRSCEK